MRIDGAIPPSDNVQTENLNRARTSKPESLPRPRQGVRPGAAHFERASSRN